MLDGEQIILKPIPLDVSEESLGDSFEINLAQFVPSHRTKWTICESQGETEFEDLSEELEG